MSHLAWPLERLTSQSGPFVCSVMQIDPKWIDHNGHLNMAYYNIFMDESLGEFFRALGLSWPYLKARNLSTMTAEIHMRYIREVSLGDPLQVSIRILGVDDKRIHTFEELRHAEEGWLSATSENMSLHIDMSVRKVAPFPPDMAERLRAVADAHAKLPRPDGAGRKIEMPAKQQLRVDVA
jgi:acyl-CoA thioester hydrolase